MKYLINKNKNFWKAIHQANSAPLWNCIVSSSWPINPKNRKSKLVILVANDNLFKVIATASGLKYEKLKI
jgi:hypothetical protein